VLDCVGWLPGLHWPHTSVVASCKQTGPTNNAVECRYDKYAFDRMYQGAMGGAAARGCLAQLTFLRMGNLFLDNWDAFNAFMAKMNPDDSCDDGI
jgi:hypothetical protein